MFFGLESEVTALRCIQAVWAAADPHVPREERVAQDVRLLPEMTRVVVQSFRPEGRKVAQEAAASAPPGCHEEAPLRRIGGIVDTAVRLGSDLTDAQLEAVRSALQRRVTLIHGPTGHRQDHSCRLCGHGLEVARGPHTLCCRLQCCSR